MVGRFFQRIFVGRDVLWRAHNFGKQTKDIMTRFTLAIITALAALTPDAAAASCATYPQARASHPNTYLVYRLEHRKPGDQKCWYAPAKSSRGGVEGRHALVKNAAVAGIRPASAGGQAAFRASTGFGTQWQAGVAPGPRETTPYDRVIDAFTTINHFSVMPWHDDLWLRMQVYWLQANGVIDGTARWVISARWP